MRRRRIAGVEPLRGVREAEIVAVPRGRAREIFPRDEPRGDAGAPSETYAMLRAKLSVEKSCCGVSNELVVIRLN